MEASVSRKQIRTEKTARLSLIRDIEILNFNFKTFDTKNIFRIKIIFSLGKLLIFSSHMINVRVICGLKLIKMITHTSYLR